MDTKAEENCILKEINEHPDVFKLKTLLESSDTRFQATEAIAELAKTEKHRVTFSDSVLIDELLELLTDSNTDQVALAIRALANICYENDTAVNMINEEKFDSIVALFKNPLNLENKLIINNVSVLLMNLLHGNEDLPKTVLEKHHILPAIEQLLLKCVNDSKANECLLEFSLSILNGLTEYIEDTQSTFSDSLLILTVNILKGHLDSTNICLSCLEIIQSVLDLQDCTKTVLAEAGACEVLHTIIRKHRVNLGEEIYKLACDILVVILTDDASMDLLYDNGKGETYKNMIAWLDSSDKELLSTGILAIGNFARKDTNCIQMVQNGVSRKLIELLKQYNKSTEFSDVKIQHAILSTLKNLAIPKENKSQMVNEDILETLYPLLNQERPVVVFKLLGTFRIVIDGQEKVSTELLSNDHFVEKLTYWCYNSDHIGVRGEIPRIFSWLIKNCHTSNHLISLLNHPDSIKCIVEMISSNYAIMQNEAHFALLTLIKNLETQSDNILDKFWQIIIEAPIGKHLNYAVNTYSSKWDEHTIQNHLCLAKYLIQSEIVTRNLQQFDYFKSLSSLENHKNTVISTEVKNIISQIKI